LFKYPLPKQMFKKRDNSLVLKSFFKLNEEQLVPFINQDFFNFLHLFKYNLKKSYAMGRINLVYYNIKAIGHSLRQKKFTTVEEDEKLAKGEIGDKVVYGNLNAIGMEQINDPDYYKNYLYAYRKFMTRDTQQIMKMLKFAWDSDSKVISETLRAMKEMIKAPIKQQEEALKKIEESSDKEEARTQTDVTTQEPVQGGKKTKDYKIRVNKHKTRRMKGGLFKLSSVDPRGVIIDKLAKYLYVDNIKNKVNDDEVNPLLSYAIEEQRLFLGLALQYFKTLRESQRTAKENNNPKLKSDALVAFDKKLDNAGIMQELPFENYKEDSPDKQENVNINNYLNENYPNRSISELIDE